MEDEINTGSTRLIAIIFVCILFGLFIATLMESNLGGNKLSPSVDTILTGIGILIFIGVVRRTIWGRWLAYPILCVALLGIPIGTFFGGIMIWQLTKYRHNFNKWF